MRSIRRALITGATSGIGAAFAAELPATTDLLLTGRDAQRLDDARARLGNSGRCVETHVADLADPSARDGLIKHAEAFGIDLLVNNAGSGRVGRFLDSPPEAERETVLLNVVAVVELTRRLLPGMLYRARHDGRRCGVIIVSSTTAFAPVPLFATYAASKAFGLSFAEALADELRGEPADVLALCPGATRTAFGRRAGFALGDVPGASQPGAVAAAALAGLGNRTVVIAGRVNQAALGPALVPRRLLTGAVGAAMRVLVARRG